MTPNLHPTKSSKLCRPAECLSDSALDLVPNLTGLPVSNLVPDMLSRSPIRPVLVIVPETIKKI